MFEFYQRHKAAVWVAATAAAAVGLFFLIWATAGTSLPFIAAAGAKIGLNLGFLSTWSVPAASAAAAAIVSGAGFTAAVITSITVGLASKASSFFKCCFCKNKEDTPDGEPTLTTSSDAIMVAAGMTPNKKEEASRDISSASPTPDTQGAANDEEVATKPDNVAPAVQPVEEERGAVRSKLI